jgi:hypothetical protein
MSKLAVFGGQPIRTKPLHVWPYWDEKEEKALMEVLRSGKWWFGEKVEEFEARYATWQELPLSRSRSGPWASDSATK